MKQIIGIALSAIILAGAARAQSPGRGQPHVIFLAVDGLNSCPDAMHGKTF